MRTVYDTCVIIDALQEREPFYRTAQKLILAAAGERLHAVLTAKSLMDIHYLMRKFFHSEAAARAEIAKLLEIFEIEATLESDCTEALRSEMSDFEDAAIAAAARRIGADAIVTRNVKDYEKSPVPALLPDELLSRL